MLYVKRKALESALQGAKETYPDEFIGLLRGEDKEKDTFLTELIIAPLSSYDEDSSSYSPYFIPSNTMEKATFHSHPSPGPAKPSRADRHFFARFGCFHFIASYPFGLGDVNAFDEKGKQIEFAIVD